MSRYTPNDLTGALAPINPELEKIKLAIDDTLSRKNDTPNSMQGNLDMNSQRILNLPAPVAAQEPVRKADFDALEAELESEVDAAVLSANNATSGALAATASATSAASLANQKAQEAEDAILALQVVAIGDFDAGFTITARNEVALYDDGASATYYRWDGALPKTVTASSTPAGTGGIGEGAWVDVGQASLRSDLANDDDNLGASLVAVNHKNVRELLLQTESGQSNFEKIATLARSGDLRLAILGDSTASGVGTSSGGVYGERNLDYGAGYSLLWGYNLIKSDQNFYQPEVTSLYYRRNSSLDTVAIPSAFPCYLLTVSESPEIDPITIAENKSSLSTNKLTIYHNIRTADTAAIFDVVIKTTAGVVIATESIDTYAPSIDFGAGGILSVLSHLSKTTVTLPSSYKEVTVEINNVRTADRGAGAPADGTALCCGFALGNGVDVRNYAVSSTTLNNLSDANVVRGVTTTERLQKAYDMNANAIVLNWGTNDSKAGVSTVAAFKADLITRVGEIRSYLPDCAIILATTAAGEESSIYENNVDYFEAIREVAQLEKCGLLDGERILSQFERTAVVADEVHPSEYGYYALASALSALTQCENLKSEPQRMEVSLPVFASQKETFSGGSDFTGNWVLLQDIAIGNSLANAQLDAFVNLNLYRAAADIELFEFALTFSNSSGGTAPPSGTQTYRGSYPRVPAGSGDAWAVVSLSKTLTSTQFFTLGPYYLKLWVKNYGLRPTNSNEISWRFRYI